ncbi:hypothetical protein ASC64_14930 [Nocardioides sp. Root122]|uniref:hypothetical protein n=1 Tax=Nocardioides TaxID=1839 RepID=UPI00070287F1|nr:MULTISPECIES: hypothetical protein [Nocardioides]KQV64994.1 hypothetical protein ASC64_14930 [Nocardioides sp. Root122]MCK9823440.1 hypothetical protein [Nocardioides cavernae]
MKSFLAVIVLLGCVGCSSSAPTTGADDSDGNAVALITRPDGQNDTIWSTGRGHLRVEAGCILFKGQLAVFPFGTSLANGSTSLKIRDGDESIPLDGSAEVDVTGSEVPLGEDGDWDHAMDAANLARWSECRRRADISEYADWWQVGQLHLVGDE